MSRWRPAYVGLGSNVGETRDHLRSARAALVALPDVRCAMFSPVFRTEPVGIVDQPHFLNAVVGLLTRTSPAQFFARLVAIEAANGRDRRREHRWGPRTLDLDLLVFSNEERAGADLVLPHPRIAERNFVLCPLAAIAPDLNIPGLGRVDRLVATSDMSGIEQVRDFQW